MNNFGYYGGFTTKVFIRGEYGMWGKATGTKIQRDLSGKLGMASQGERCPGRIKAEKKLLLLAVTTVFLSACSLPGPPPQGGGKKPPRTFRGRTNAPMKENSEFSGRVVGVVDGDTVDVLADKQPVRIRLYGIDCPEKRQAYGMRAKQAASALCFGSRVTVRPRDKDRYGRLVAEIILPDGRNLNREMVRQGYAWWYRQYSTDSELEKLEREARSARRGLWTQDNPEEPSRFRSSRTRSSGAGQGKQKQGPS